MFFRPTVSSTSVAVRARQLLDWSHILKRKDVEHRATPDHFQALAAYRADFRQQIGRSDAPAVCFVVLSKIDHRIKPVSTRYANETESNLFRR